MTDSIPAILLIVCGFLFAFALGALYSGACMGMAVASGSVSRRWAIWLMMPFLFAGAALAGDSVERTVGHHIFLGEPVPIGVALALLGSSTLIATLFLVRRLPVSTTLVVIASAIGSAFAVGTPVDWRVVLALFGLWIITPVVSGALAYGLVHLLHRLRPTAVPFASHSAAGRATFLALGLATAFAVGANDVSNSTGAFVMAGVSGAVFAALIGGLGLALGALCFGRYLVDRVAFGIVDLDRPMAVSAQLAQSAWLLLLVSLGFYSSMNQAMNGALIGVGLKVGGRSVRWTLLREIFFEWGAGPLVALGLSTALSIGARSIGLG